MASKPVSKRLNTAKPATAKTTTAATPAPTKPQASKAGANAAKATPKPVAKPVLKNNPTQKSSAPAIKVVNQSATGTEKPKSSKVKMERDSFTMPKEEYAQIASLKKRLEGMAQPAKKSELLRAGLKLLAAMDDATLKAALASVPTIKTGRPKK